MQPLPTNEEPGEQGQKENHQFHRLLLPARQTTHRGRCTTPTDAPTDVPHRPLYRPLVGPPHQLTLPFSIYPDTDGAASRHTNSSGLLRRARLVSDPDVQQHTLPVPVAIPGEDHDSFPPTREELISLLDTAVMISVRPRERELGQSILVNTLIEDTSQQATLALPAVTRAYEKTDRPDQRKDITTTAGGAALAGIGDLSYAVLRYATNVAMTHMVSPALYGIFGEVYTATVILGWIAKLGLEGILVRLLPTYRVKGELDLVGGLTRFATWFTLISGLLIGALFFAFAAIIARLVYHDPSYRLPLQEVALLIPLIALQLVFSAGLQAFKEIRWKVSVDRLSQPLITLLALVIFYLLGWRMEALSFSAIGGFFCSVLIGQIVLSKVLKRFTRDIPPRYTPRVWVRFTVPMFFNGLIQSILDSTDILFLGILSTPVQVGIYIAAERVSYFVAMPLIALSMIFSPMIAEYYVKGEHKQLASMFKMVTKWSLSLSLPMFLCCLAFHDAILGVFGPQYTASGLVLIILCFGNLVYSGTGSAAYVLSMTGRLRIISINSIISIIINIGLSFILVQRLNILGAALAAALAVIIIYGLCLVEVYWIMKIHPYRWSICKPLIAGAAAYLVGVLLLHFIHPGSGRFAIVEQLGLIIPFILVYVLVMVLLRFSEEDQIVFDAVLAKFGRRRSANSSRASR